MECLGRLIDTPPSHSLHSQRGILPCVNFEGKLWGYYHVCFDDCNENYRTVMKQRYFQMGLPDTVLIISAESYAGQPLSEYNIN